MDQVSQNSLAILAAAVAVWSIPWQGVALWKAAQRKDLWWFIALLVLHTAGILDMIYIFIFSKRPTAVKKDQTQNASLTLDSNEKR